MVLAATFSLESSAQETLRLSLAAEQAAEARRTTAAALSASDLKLGPTIWEFDTGVGFEANDNIRLVSQSREGDLIFRPQAGAAMLLPVSEKNAINLGIAGGYSAYVQHSQFDRWYLRPGSELSFDLYAGDFWINLHDRLSILEDSYQDPTVVGVADYALLQNVAGTTGVLDLNKVRLKLGYDHVNYDVLSGAGQNTGRTPDGESEVFSSSIGYNFKPGLVSGLEAGGSLVEYAPTSANQLFTEATEWNIGWFTEAQVSHYTALRASIGYDVFSPETEGPSRAAGDFTGVYVQAGLRNRLNRYLDLALTGGRNINFTVFGGTMDLAYARLSLNWNLIYETQLTTSFDFEHGTQLGFAQEQFDRYGPGVRVGRDLTRKLSASARYQWYYRTSDLGERDYAVNIALVDLQYQF